MEVSQNQISRTEIDQKVKEIVAEALAREVSDVEMTSNLVHDLSAESLDFLDIVFKIERAFQIQITRGEMEKAAKGNMTDEEFAPKGVISEAGLKRLSELMPESSHLIKPGLRPNLILSLFTVKTFSNMVEGKLTGKNI